MKAEDDCFLAAMTNLDRVFKSGDITLPTKVHLVKAMVFGRPGVLQFMGSQRVGHD